jgi:hypothetical protein
VTNTRKALIAIGTLTSFLALGSCAKQSYTIKVLDSVLCFSDKCPSEEYRWKQCIAKGFLDSLPSGVSVSSARNYRELIEYEFLSGEFINKKYSQNVSPEGIVFDEEIGSETEELKSTAKQYCTGSEYIVRR